MKSKDPKTNVTPPDFERILRDFKREAKLLVSATLHYDGPGSGEKEDYKWAWRFVKKVAGLKEVD